MRLKIILIIFTIFLFFNISITVCADPVVSFTSSSRESKTILTPTINADVTDYRWSVIGRRDSFDLETGWIPRSDVGDHVSILDDGSYFVTITGRNTDTDLTSSFTNKVTVTVHEDYVEPPVEVAVGVGYSRIINSLPEPLKSFLKERSGFELLLIVFGSLMVLGVVTRRKKIKKYISLETYNAK